MTSSFLHLNRGLYPLPSFIGNPGDDQAAVAGTGHSGKDISSTDVDSEKGGFGKGRGDNSSVPGRMKNLASYEPTLLRQLQVGDGEKTK